MTDIWLRLTKAGDSYAGEYSLDGTAWTALAAPVTNPMADPDFGLFAIAPQAQGDGTLVPFEYFTLDGPDPIECGCVASGDEFDGAALDKDRWNAIVREDRQPLHGRGRRAEGDHRRRRHLPRRDPADTRNLLLQTRRPRRRRLGASRRRSRARSATATSRAGCSSTRTTSNYVKFDLISDEDTTAINRIELRSRGGRASSRTRSRSFAAARRARRRIWLRLTKAGDQYTGEYSFDGDDLDRAAGGRAERMVSPRFGLFTAGVNSPGGEVVFDYFSVDGETRLPGRGARERAAGARRPDGDAHVGDRPAGRRLHARRRPTPTRTSSPTAGTSATARTSEEQNPSHTYAEAGVYTAEVTVSDGEAQATKSVTVTVLGPDDPDAAFRALVFSKTTGFRHDSIPAGIAAIRSLGEERGFQVDATEDATVFTDAILQQYDVVVFLSTTGIR